MNGVVNVIFEIGFVFSLIVLIVFILLVFFESFSQYDYRRKNESDDE